MQALMVISTRDTIQNTRAVSALEGLSDACSRKKIGARHGDVSARHGDVSAKGAEKSSQLF